MNQFLTFVKNPVTIIKYGLQVSKEKKKNEAYYASLEKELAKVIQRSKYNYGYFILPPQGSDRTILCRITEGNITIRKSTFERNGRERD